MVVLLTLNAQALATEGGAGTNEDRYGGHEGTNDNDDATNDEHEDDDGG